MNTNPEEQVIRGKAQLALIQELFIDRYPEYRPNFADCQLMMACVYAIAVRHAMSPGQIKSLELLKKKLDYKEQQKQPQSPQSIALVQELTADE